MNIDPVSNQPLERMNEPNESPLVLEDMGDAPGSALSDAPPKEGVENSPTKTRVAHSGQPEGDAPPIDTARSEYLKKNLEAVDREIVGATVHETKRPEPTPNTVIEPEAGLISVNNCPACKGHHHRVAYSPMRQTLGLFNHYYSCEETGEPVPVSIVALEDRMVELPSFIVEKLITAVLAGKWVAAIWRVEDGKVHLDRMTQNFPREDLPRVVDLLAENLRKEVDPMADKQIKVNGGAPPTVRGLFKERHR